MAISTPNTPVHAGFPLISIAARLTGAVKSAFDSLTRAIVINSTAQQRLDQVERLNQLTDAELAERGLKRTDIVHHVFRDLFWT